MFNKLKIYNQLLELDALTVRERNKSLYGIFQRDFINSTPYFRAKLVRPTPREGEDTMKTLLHHLTTCTTNKDESSREYDRERSIRVHWIKHHICENSPGIRDIFSVKEKNGIRTYIYDKNERYVIILEPKGNDSYYLITAYYLSGANIYKIENKARRRLDVVY